MLTTYINVSQADNYERAANFLLKTSVVAFGRQIDVQTGLVLPQHHVIVRITAAAAAALLLPVTLLGLALQSLSVTHWQHADSCQTSFKPIALVVHETNWEKVAQEIRLLDAVTAACFAIGQSKPQIVLWNSKKLCLKSETKNQPDSDLSATDLINDHTPIFLSVTTSYDRVFAPFCSNGWFSGLPNEINSPACSFILYQEDTMPWARIGGYREERANINNQGAYSFTVDKIAAIPSVVKEILEKQSL